MIVGGYENAMMYWLARAGPTLTLKMARSSQYLSLEDLQKGTAAEKPHN